MPGACDDAHTLGVIEKINEQILLVKLIGKPPQNNIKVAANQKRQQRIACRNIDRYSDARVCLIELE